MSSKSAQRLQRFLDIFKTACINFHHSIRYCYTPCDMSGIPKNAKANLGPMIRPSKPARLMYCSLDWGGKVRNEELDQAGRAR